MFGAGVVAVRITASIASTSSRGTRLVVSQSRTSQARSLARMTPIGPLITVTGASAAI